jgi:hypothetical protein
VDQTVERLNPERLMRLLTEQRELYRGLEALSQRQRSSITGDRPEALLDVLTQRQRIILALGRVNEQLAPYRERWAEAYAQLSESARRQAAALLDEINSTLRTILLADHEDGAMLSVRRQTLSRELGRTADGQAANSAYARQARTSLGGGSADMTG